MSDQASVQSPEERLMQFIEQEDSPVENLDEEPVEEEEHPTESEGESEEGESEEDSEESEVQVLRLKHNGQEIEKPVEEVIALAQQGFDYTQKTQQLAEERKAVESYAQAVKAQEQQFQAQVQMQSALIQEIAQVTAIDNQLAQFQQINWTALTDSDPVEAQKLFFTYSQLQAQRGQLVNGIQGKQSAIQQQEEAKRVQMLQQGAEVLANEIPDWGEAKAKELKTTGKEYGFSDQELSTIVDPRMVKVLHDAAQWRKLQASKPSLEKKVAQAKPMVKPGAKDSKAAQTSQVKQVREALKKTGKAEFAAKAIERLL